MGFLPFASFRLWQESRPLSEDRFFHCEMRRGFSRFRKKEPLVEEILNQNTTAQSIGLLAQQVVWEFHHDLSLFYQDDAIESISTRIALDLTFPVKCGLQAGSLGKGHVTSTNRAKELGYREEFYDDVGDNHQEKQ